MPQRFVHGLAGRAQRVSRRRRAPIDQAGNTAHSSFRVWFALLVHTRDALPMRVTLSTVRSKRDG